MNSAPGDASSGARMTISIVLERRQIQHGQWSMPAWQVLEVITGGGPESGRTVIHSDEHSQKYLWSGLSLRLHRDAAESYWYNLVGKQPSLFIVCSPREGGELAPFLVSANYDEAAAYMETDVKVFATPMSPEVYRWLEQYVLDNYEPKEPYKRKRKRWVEESDGGKR